MSTYGTAVQEKNDIDASQEQATKTTSSDLTTQVLTDYYQQFFDYQRLYQQELKRSPSFTEISSLTLMAEVEQKQHNKHSEEQVQQPIKINIPKNSRLHMRRTIETLYDATRNLLQTYGYDATSRQFVLFNPVFVWKTMIGQHINIHSSVLSQLSYYSSMIKQHFFYNFDLYTAYSVEHNAGTDMQQLEPLFNYTSVTIQNNLENIQQLIKELLEYAGYVREENHSWSASNRSTNSSSTSNTQDMLDCGLDWLKDLVNIYIKHSGPCPFSCSGMMKFFRSMHKELSDHEFHVVTCTIEQHFGNTSLRYIIHNFEQYVKTNYSTFPPWLQTIILV